MTTRRILTAFQLEEVSQILDYVHDRPFELARLRLDLAESSLEIPVRIRTRKHFRIFGIPFPRYGEEVTSLRINRAKSFSIDDKAEVGEGDICSIEYSDNQVRLIGSLPVDIFVAVDALHIELDLPSDAFFA